MARHFRNLRRGTVAFEVRAPFVLSSRARNKEVRCSPHAILSILGWLWEEPPRRRQELTPPPSRGDPQRAGFPVWTTCRPIQNDDIPWRRPPFGTKDQVLDKPSEDNKRNAAARRMHGRENSAHLRQPWRPGDDFLLLLLWRRFRTRLAADLVSPIVVVASNRRG